MANMTLTLGTGLKASLAKLISVTDSDLNATLEGITGTTPEQGSSYVDLVGQGYVRIENVDIKNVQVVTQQQGATIYDYNEAGPIYYLEGDSITPEHQDDANAVLISMDFVEVAAEKIGFRFTRADIFLTIGSVTYQLCYQEYSDQSTPLIVNPGLSLKLKFLIQL